MLINDFHFVKELITGNLSASNFKGSFLGGVSEQAAVLERYVKRINETRQLSDILLNSLSSSIDVLTDEEANSQEVASGSHKVDKDYFDVVRKAFDSCFKFLGSTQNPSDLTFVDGDGYSYTFIKGSTASPVQMQYTDSEDNLTTMNVLERVSKSGGGYWYYMSNYVIDVTGSVKISLGLLLRELATNATVNQITSDVSSLVLQGRATTESVYATLSEHLHSANATVKDWATRINRATAQGGVIGCINFIVQALQNVNASTLNASGAMEFTDNDSLVPKQFISGIISGVAGVVGNVLSAIHTPVTMILGAAFSIGSSLVKFFTNEWAEKKASDTRATAIDYSEASPRVTLPETPFAMMQQDVSGATLSATLTTALDDGLGIAILAVPGGWLHVGQNGKGGYRWEFHPAINHTYEYLGMHYLKVKPLTYDGHSDPIFTVCVPQAISSVYLENYWGNGYSTNDLFNYTDVNGVLTERADEILRWIVLHNTALFYYWLYCARIESYSNDALFPVYDDGALYAKTGFVCGWNPSVGTNNTAVLDETKSCSILAYLSLNPSMAQADLEGSSAYMTQHVRTGSDQHIDCNPICPSWTNIMQYVSVNDQNYGLNTTGCWENIGAIGDIVLVDYVHGHPFDTPKWDEGDSMSSFFSSVPSGTSTEINLYPTLGSMLVDGRFFDEIRFFQSIGPGIQQPQYDASTYDLWIAVALITTVAVVTAATVTTIAATRAINKARATRTAAVEQAWNNFVSDPTDGSAYAAYRKAVKKNNLLSSIFGGTKYSATSYWDSTKSSYSSLDSIKSIFAPQDAQQSTDVDAELDSIYLAITGGHL